MADTIPDIVVLLPGISGSELRKDDRIVWGWSGGVLLRNLITAGKRLRQDLAIDGDSQTATVLDDGIRASRLLPDFHVIPGLWKIDGYGVIQRYLQETFALKLGVNFFPFPYDWRRDNRAAAYRLSKESAQWLSTWRATSGNTRAKLILIGHSMGGLVARYFLEVFEGWRDTRALITFGTPYSGSLNAVDSLVNGLDRFHVDLTNIARRLLSMHQLLPIYRCFERPGEEPDYLKPGTVSNIDSARHTDAINFHDEIDSAAIANSRLDDYQKTNYRIIPIVGYHQPTYQTFSMDHDKARLSRTLGGVELDGDGTVPRLSSVPNKFDIANATFVATKHAALQNSAPMLSHISGAISSLYLEDVIFRGPVIKPPVQISLDVRDIYWANEPLLIRAKATKPDERLAIAINDGFSDASIHTSAMRFSTDDWQEYLFDAATPGVYRVTISGVRGLVEPVSDVFEVVDPGLS